MQTVHPEIDPYLSNAVISSMAATSESPPPANPAVCPSGQCTFPPYTTLALCHSTEDITSQLLSQPWNDTGYPTAVSLPGMTIYRTYDVKTFWVTTIFGDEQNTTHSLGLETDPALRSLKHPNSSMDDLAHIYLAYHDPCLTDTTDASTLFNPKNWRAYKATLRLCLQTRSTEFNISTTTKVVQNHSDTQWEHLEDPRQGPHCHGVCQYWSTNLKDSSDNYTIGLNSTWKLGKQIGTSFNVSGAWLTHGYSNIFGGTVGSTLVADIMGNDVFKCPNATEYGFEGFTRRIAHIANGVTNA
jgi:hypothetical protein